MIERLGLAPPDRPLLAIASCGSAALAAAVVARAADWRLEVFVPPNAHPAILARLQALGAAVRSCPRTAGTRGDPCYLRFRDTVAAGALPFTCQGSQNGLTIEGGATLGYETIDQLGDVRLDRPFVQVGGGALASACIQAFSDAVLLGRLTCVPRLHAVQTRGAFPLWRAWRRVAQRILDRLRFEPDADAGTGAPGPGDAMIASRVHHDADPSLVDEEVAQARLHRSQFMWPWEETPRSIAEGILDDETYDWAAVVSGMLRTGGYPIVVDEDALEDANNLAREATGVAVTHTGSAGLAGLVEAIRRDPGIGNEQVGLLFSGGGGR